MSNHDFIYWNEGDIPLIAPKRMIIFAGHPDDELISCGGTILKYNLIGTKITIVVATSGIGGYSQDIYKNSIEEKREEELQKVAEILDCDIIELKYTDLQITRQKIAKITNLIRDYNPQIILLPHYTDFHRIHRNLSFITRESIYHSATGKAYGGHEKNWIPLGVYYYESPSCKFQYIDSTVFSTVDITNFWTQKREIFKNVYSSQKEVLERVIEWAEDTAILRGNEINTAYGESFIPETTYTPLRLLLG